MRTSVLKIITSSSNRLLASVCFPATLIFTTLEIQAQTQENVKAWPERRQQIERSWLDLLGEFPTEIPALQPIMTKVTFEQGCPSDRLSKEQLAVLKTQYAEEDGRIDRYHVSFQTEAEDRVTAWLFVPKEARKKPTPAMICIHSTTKGSGKDATIGLSSPTPVDPPDSDEGGRSYGLHLARYGYITLSIDLLTDGERVEPGEEVLQTRPFYVRHPEWSIVGKNTWDIMRSVDFLETLDFVDRNHIGCLGLSLGGHTSVFAGAFEPRITATVSIGGVLDWHRPRGPWSRDKGRYIYIKKVYQHR